MSTGDGPTRDLQPVIRQSAALFGETADSSMSLEVQLERITAWGMASGEYRRVLPPIVEHAVSGAAPIREAFVEMRAAARPDLDFAIYKYDRLARDLLRQEEIVRAVLPSRVLSITEPNSDLVRGIFGAVNQDFRRQLSERIADMYRGRALRGVQGGRGPYGYRRAGVQVVVRSDGSSHERPHGDFLPDEARAAVVREVFGRYDAGEGRWAIAADLTARGVATPRGAAAWGLTMVTGMLGQPMYAGYVTYEGRRIPTGTGGWVTNPRYAIVEPAVWERVQERLASTARTRGNKAVSSWLDGLVEHACGRRMYLVPMADRTYPRFQCASQGQGAARRCGVGQRTVSAPRLEQAVYGCLAHDLAGRVTVADAVAAAEASSGGKRTRDRAGEVAAELARVAGRVERARGLYLEYGDDASRAAFDRIREASVGERARLEAEAAMLPPSPDPGRYAEVGAWLGAARSGYERLSDQGRRGLLEAMGVAVFADGEVSIRYAGEMAGFVPTPTVRRV